MMVRSRETEKSNSSASRNKGVLTTTAPTRRNDDEIEKNNKKKGMLTTAAPTIRKHVSVVTGIQKSNKKPSKSTRRKRNDEEIEKNKKKEAIVQVGDTVNLSDLLFTTHRDYLIIHAQNYARVKAKDLVGKVVVLHFMSLTDHFDTWRAPIVNLRDIYTKLHPQGNFEIVFVAPGGDNSRASLMGSNTRQYFRKIVSMMPPCPAIPLSDRNSIKRLGRIFGVGAEFYVPLGPESFIIDPNGVVLQSYATPLLLRYGAAGYPFTSERIQFLDSKDNFVRMHPFSVEKYLASPERDYLINNKGEHVPLRNLDDKVVGLYFCPCLDGLNTTRRLEIVYQELSKDKENFEIILIYTHGWCEHEDTCGLVDEDSFLDEIKTLPWLVLPFTDTDCNKKLQRIFQNPQDLEYPKPAARLIIIGPHGKFMEPLATQILKRYGAPAYPFTLHSAVSLELERVKNIEPETFWELDAIFTRNDGSQVQFSQIVGKKIIVLYQTFKWKCCYETLGKLKARYFQMKGTDDEFEVIHALCDMWYDDKFEAPMPWLMPTPFSNDSDASQVMFNVFGNTGGLIAFDRDGSVVRVTIYPRLGESKVFPFYHAGDMENEVLLNVKYKIASRLEIVFDG